MRSRFDEQLDQLNKELISMGALCEEAIGRSVRALRDGDPDLASTAIPLYAETDRMERVIEDRCLRLLLQQQPVARDLRQITAAMKMITDLERIGDQAADIASIVQYLNGRSVKPCMPLIPMAEAAMRMVTGSVDAYVKRDLEAARLVIEQDDAVDEYFERVKDYLIDIIANSPEEGEYALDLLMIAKYLERIGDHATNIAEWVVFSVTGVHKDLQHDLVCGR